ncbi:hypothetical protein, partial [Ammoniphilus sp. CFH 90114]|uniref:hypothetical protein n=1 Tax=Ammoniphilus sp. CFH 90114 TaxID=2493665 RepID=UPI0010253E74
MGYSIRKNRLISMLLILCLLIASFAGFNINHVQAEQEENPSVTLGVLGDKSLGIIKAPTVTEATYGDTALDVLEATLGSQRVKTTTYEGLGKMLTGIDG